jgi:hypothetical protein
MDFVMYDVQVHHVDAQNPVEGGHVSMNGQTTGVGVSERPWGLLTDPNQRELNLLRAHLQDAHFVPLGCAKRTSLRSQNGPGAPMTIPSDVSKTCKFK